MASKTSFLDLLYEAAFDGSQIIELLDALIAIDDSRSMEHLLRHLERIERIFRALDTGRDHLHLFLDQVPLAVVLVDEEQQIVERNIIAERELARDAFVKCDGGQLLLARPECQKRLVDAVRSVIGKEVESVVLEFHEETPTMQMVVRHGYVAGLFSEGATNNIVCVSFLPSVANRVARRQWLAQRYGLTARESELATLFVRYPSVPELASRMRRSEHTVRSQIKSVFQKTGVRGQAELMRLLLTEDSAINPERDACIPEVSPAAQHCHMSDGQDLCYTEYGPVDGRPVFYFHSFTGCRTECAHDLAVLERLGVRMIAVDRPGYGLSTNTGGGGFLQWAQYVRQLANRLDIENFHIVAMSGASAYGLACASVLYGQVQGLALISPMGEVREPDDLIGMMPLNRKVYELILRCPAELARFLAYLMARAFTVDPEAYLKRVLPDIAPSDQRLLSDPHVRNHAKKTFVESRGRHLRGFSEDMIRYARPWGIDLQAISCRVTIWHGDDNRHVPLRMAQAIASQLADCRTHFLPGEGYYLNYSHWGAILEDLVVN